MSEDLEGMPQHAEATNDNQSDSYICLYSTQLLQPTYTALNPHSYLQHVACSFRTAANFTCESCLPTCHTCILTTVQCALIRAGAGMDIRVVVAVVHF